ncbi:MAG TPA: superoxide dismutase family protein, partial [Sorangium sp.]|nr:superoxide dismutase family protein [Sorangium sp.]
MTKPAYSLSLLASFALVVAACGGAPEPAPAVPDVPAQPAQPAPEAPAAPATPAPEASPQGDGAASAPVAAAPVTVEVPIEARTNSKLKGSATFTEVDG